MLHDTAFHVKQVLFHPRPLACDVIKACVVHTVHSPVLTRVCLTFFYIDDN